MQSQQKIKELVRRQVRDRGARIADRLPAPVQPLLRNVLDRLKHSGIGLLSVQVAYSILFALPPVFVLTLAMGAMLQEYTGISVADYLHRVITDFAPEESQQLLQDLVDQAIVRINPGFASASAIIFLGIALWGSMSGISIIMMATNRAYGVRETRGFWRRWGTILLLAVLIPALTVLAIVLVFFGESLSEWILDQTGYDLLNSGFAQTVSALIVLVIGLLILYLIAPNIDHAMRWSLPGALLGGVALLAAIALFQLVLKHVALANIYGAASSVIILLYLFRMIGQVYVFGAVLNGVLSENHDQRRQEDLEQHPEKVLFSAGGHEVYPMPGKVV